MSQYVTLVKTMTSSGEPGGLVGVVVGRRRSLKQSLSSAAPEETATGFGKSFEK